MDSGAALTMQKSEIKRPATAGRIPIKSPAVKPVWKIVPKKDAPSVTTNTIMVFSGSGEIDSKGEFAHSLAVTSTPGQVLTSGTDGALTWASGSGGSTVITFTVSLSGSFSQESYTISFTKTGQTVTIAMPAFAGPQVGGPHFLLSGEFDLPDEFVPSAAYSDFESGGDISITFPYNDAGADPTFTFGLLTLNTSTPSESTLTWTSSTNNEFSGVASATLTGLATTLTYSTDA